MRRELPTDSCPGVTKPFVAEDGAIVRVRLPGGRVDRSTLRALAACSAEFGSGELHMTSRGNLQIRGVADDSVRALGDRLTDLGLLPSVSHDRMRNYVAAPDESLDALVHDLDARVLADLELAHLPGRWLFVVTDDSGFGLDAPFDLALQLRAAQPVRILAPGHEWVLDDGDDPVTELINLARRFLEVRANERTWQVRELPSESIFFADSSHASQLPEPSVLPVGVQDGPTVVGIPFGVLEPEHVRALVEVDDDFVLTHQRCVVLRGEGPTSDLLRLSETGLVVDDDDPRLRMSACIGAPQCRRTNVSTRDIASAATAYVPPGVLVHVSGCERRCGHPQTPYVDVLEPTSASDVRLAITESPS